MKGWLSGPFFLERDEYPVPEMAVMLHRKTWMALGYDVVAFQRRRCRERKAAEKFPGASAICLSRMPTESIELLAMVCDAELDARRNGR